MYKIFIQGQEDGDQTIECEGFVLLADCGKSAWEIIQNVNVMSMARMMNDDRTWASAFIARAIMKTMKEKKNDEQARGEADHDGRDAGAAADDAAEG